MGTRLGDSRSEARRFEKEVDSNATEFENRRVANSVFGPTPNVNVSNNNDLTQSDDHSSPMVPGNYSSRRREYPSKGSATSDYSRPGYRSAKPRNASIPKWKSVSHNCDLRPKIFPTASTPHHQPELWKNNQLTNQSRNVLPSSRLSHLLRTSCLLHVLRFT